MIDTPRLRRADDVHGDVGTKRALLAVSRSLESLASRTAAAGSDLAVVALFEEAQYFGYERERYAELARSATVVVGFVGDAPPMPDGVHRIELPKDHVLAGEWSVAVVSPTISACLVAADLRRVVAEDGLERGRLFAPEISTDPGWVTSQVERIVAEAGPLLAPETGSRLLAHARRASERDPDLPEHILRDELLAGWWRSMMSSKHLDRVEHLAFTDPLTGAYNRRFLDRYLDRLGPRAPVLAAIALDFDRFKAINDTWGHSVGDTVLRAFAKVVRERVRATDLLVRLGGDEWLILLPAVELDQAVERAESILAGFAEERLPAPAEAVTLRASAGVGVFPAAALDLDAVDAALYRAKQQGGGRVVVAAASSAPVASSAS